MRRLATWAVAVGLLGAGMARAADFDAVPEVAQVWIDDPLDQSLLTPGPVEVVGHATDPRRLDSVRLTVDGAVVGEAGGGPSLVTLRWTWTAEPGLHELMITGFGATITRSQPVVVFVGTGPEFPLPPPTDGTTTSTTTQEPEPTTTVVRATIPPPPPTTAPATAPPATTGAPTTVPCTMGAPTPTSPSGGASVASRTPTLSWAAAPGCPATGYTIQVSRDAGFARLEQSGSSSSTQWTVPGALTNCVTYFWRVASVAGRTTGPWSSTAQFRVDVGGCA